MSRDEKCLIRVPPEAVRVRAEYPPEEPEWSPAAYRAAKAVERHFDEEG